MIRSSRDPTFCGIFVCGPLQFKCQFCPLFHNNSSNAGRESPGYLSWKVTIAIKACFLGQSNLMLTADFSRLLSSSHKDTNTRVRRGILSGSEIQCRIRENAKYLDGTRDLTVTWQAGFAKVSPWDASLAKTQRCSGLK